MKQILYLLCVFSFFSCQGNKNTEAVADAQDVPVVSDVPDELMDQIERTKGDVSFSNEELDAVKAKADAVRKNYPNFEKKYAEMVEAFGWSFSSQLETMKKLSQYAELKSMGAGILPLLVEKMVSAEDGIFACPLYNELQPVEKLRCADSLAPSAQQQAKMLAKKWLVAME